MLQKKEECIMIYLYQKESDQIVKYKVIIDYEKLSKLTAEIITKCSIIEKVSIEKLKYLPKEDEYLRNLSFHHLNQDNEYCHVTYNKYNSPKLVTYLTNLLSTKEYYCLSKNYTLKDILNYEDNESLELSPQEILLNLSNEIGPQKLDTLLSLNANQEPLSIYYQKVLSLITITPIDFIQKSTIDSMVTFFDDYNIYELIENLISDEIPSKTRKKSKLHY